MKKNLFYYSRLALLCVPAVMLTAQTDHTSAFTGTWKLDVAKSQFSPGPPPQSVTVTVAPDGAFAVDGIDAQGKPIKFSHAWSGGKEVPVSGVGVDNETVITKVHGRTWNDTIKINGKTVETVHSVLSPDGKTDTATFNGTDRQGRPIHNVEVYEKQ